MKMSSKQSTSIKYIAGHICPAIYLITTSLLLVMSVSCNDKKAASSRIPVITVEGQTLYADEIDKMLPSGLSPEDSIKITREYAKNWAEEILFYEKAKSNVPDKAYIEKLVEDYRKNLIINIYQNRLIDENVDDLILEDTIRARYEQNHEFLRLDQPMVKGVFMKLHKESPYLKVARKIIGNEKQRDELERLSLKGAAGYLYFRNQWIGLDAITERSPFDAKLDKLNKVNVLIEDSDSSYTYLFYIDSFLPEGSISPYELAEKRIRETLISEKKVSFIKSVKDDIYKSAMKHGQVKYEESNSKE